MQAWVIFPLVVMCHLTSGETPLVSWDASDRLSISVRTPNLTLVTESALICTSVRVPFPLETTYITRLSVDPDPSFTGDIVVAVCEDSGFPGLDDGSSVWDCSLGDMHSRPNPPLIRGTSCNNSGGAFYGPFYYDSMYGHGIREENKISFPVGAGVPVGGDTGLKFLVLDMHFASHGQLPRQTGVSTFNITVSRTSSPTMREVRTLKLEVLGFVRAKTTGKVRGGWRLRPGLPVIRILSLTLHSHDYCIDMVVSVKRMDGRTDVLAHQDPRKGRQVDVTHDAAAVVGVGDWIQVQCTHNNSLSKDLRVGEKDMCNAYVYYTSDGDRSQMPIYVASYDPRFGDCFKMKQKVDGLEENSDGYSDYNVTDGSGFCPPNDQIMA